jgi:hypothetical protein
METWPGVCPEENPLKILFRKWEVVDGRRYIPVLRIFDEDADQYVSDAGFIDCFDLPESINVAAKLLAPDEKETWVPEGIAALKDRKTHGNVQPDPIAGGPFRDRTQASNAAGQCKWDPSRQEFAIESNVMAQLALTFQIVSLKAQNDMANFIKLYMYKDGTRTAVRQPRIINLKYIQSGKLKFYTTGGGKKRRSLHDMV